MTTSRAAGNVAKLRDIVNVKDPRFGAKGDGVTDDASAIAAADTAAAALGVAVFFPPGTYMVDISARALAIQKTASWIGNGDATIKRKDFTASTAYYLIQEIGQTGLLTEGLIFDGQVTTVAAGSTPNTDLAAIGSYADTTDESLWRKSYGMLISNATRPTVRNCVFKNFLRAGLRVTGDNIGSTTKVVVEGCHFERFRSGSGGDGLYFGGVTDLKVSNCHVYDYQRIGIVLEFSTTDNSNNRDCEFINCTTDLGHDAVTPEQNAGFWVESGDNVQFTNCTAKRTGIGFTMNSTSDSDTGTTRSWTAPLSIVDSASIKTRIAASLRFGGTRDVHVAITNFYGESNAGTSGSAATSPGYANQTGFAAGIMIAFVDTTSGVGAQIDLKNVKLTMVDRALALGTSTEFGAVRFEQANVSSYALLSVNIDGLQTRWVKTDGTKDTNAEVLYRTSTRAHYGDIVVGGYQDAGGGNDYRFNGNLRVANCMNHSFGFVMMPIETGNAAANIQITNTPISLRTGLGGVQCNMFINACPLVDLRNDLAGLNFALIKIANSYISDANASTDRNSMQPAMMHLTGNLITRQIHLNLNGGDSTHRKLRLVAAGNEWYLRFNTESGLKLTTPNGTYAHLNMSGNVFRNNGGGAMGATKSMIEMNTDATSAIQLSGAGNAFDSAMVSGGGHVLQTNTSPAYNDAPQTVAGPFLTVFGVNALWDPI